MNNKPPSMSFWQILRQGRHYSKTWPLHNKLNGLLPENRIIRATNFALYTSSIFVILIIIWHFYFTTNLLPTILTILFALTLPIQGLWWLGKRSKQLLPSTLLFWYIELRKNLIDSKITVPPKHIEQYHPCYQDLAELLAFSIKNSPKDFFDSL